jgi:PAS domain S-box-containing protein
MVVAATTAIVVGVVFAVSQFIFMRSFQALENQNTAKAVEQVAGVLSDRIKSLHTLNHDWAAWDDTYNFVQRPSEHEDYIESNPTDTTFASAELNFILIIDTTGHLVFGKAYDLNNNKEMPIPESLDGHIFNDTLLRHSSVDDSISGIVLLPEGPLLVSSQPIITSQGQGPIMGTIIMAQFLDSRVIDTLSSAAHLPLDVVTVNERNMPSEFQIALSFLSLDAPVLTHPVNSKSIEGYALLNDIYGKPALVLRTAISRDVYASGTSTMRYLLIALLLMALLVSALLYYSLGKLVISRVGRIGSYVSDIGRSADLTKRLATTGNDELSILGRNINGMVDTLQKSEQALQARQQAEEKLRLTIESVVEGIATTDLEGTITDINDSKVLLHGYSGKEELIGKNALDLIAEGDRTNAKELMKRTLDTGYGVGGEYTMLRKDGSKFFGERLAAALKNPDGKPIGFVVSTRDITERKRAVDQLAALNEELKSLNLELETKVAERTRQLEEAVSVAEASNQAKSEFLASMSHELRTPLNAIIGFSQVLHELYFGSLNDKQAEYVTDIIDSGKHLLSLINDILDLSKIEAGKMELEVSGVKIADLLQNSLVMIKEKALAHSLSLEIQMREDIEGTKIVADERRLKQVMFNLLSNAAKFTPDGGAISVEARKEGKELIISVSDTGIGMTPQEQKRLFEAFYQASGGIKDKTPGTGLGLAITKSIVEKHGGRIWMESEGLDKGSRFTFTLPI